jgi:hypothetical protein
MSEVINLNKVRKARAKAEAKTRAVENRAAFGRTKADKQAKALEAARLKAQLDGASLKSLPNPSSDSDPDLGPT